MEKNVVVKAADMADEMQSLVIDICKDAVEQYVQESDIAGYIKKMSRPVTAPCGTALLGSVSDPMWLIRATILSISK